MFGSGAHAASRNIVVMIADDLGIDNSSFYPVGPRLATNPPPPPMPNLKRLADQGILFRNAWAPPLCTPSRATIFTGRYGFRTGVGANGDKPGQQPLTKAEFITPEAFKARPALRYSIAHIGKWDVSDGDNDPNRFGWAYFSGADPWRHGVPSYFNWNKHINAASSRTTTYATTDSVNEALGVIQRAGKNPYYIEIAFNAPHSPFHKPPNNLHTHDSLANFTAGKNVRPYFEAMVQALDTEIGRLIAGVNLANTTIIFVGDNGSTASTVAPPYDPAKSKAEVYDNGIHVPLLIAGAGIAQPGRLVAGLVSTVDIFPTVLQLAGIDQGVVPNGTKIDGISMVPYMQNPGSASLHKYIYTERFSDTYNRGYQRAIRNAEYKLISRSSGGREFYHISVDPLEKTDLLGRTLSGEAQSNLNSLQAQLTTR